MLNLNSHRLGTKIQNQLAKAVGQDLDPTAAGREILHLTGRDGMKFEWHPRIKKVYYLHQVGMTPSGQPSYTGVCIAYEITTHGDAINAVHVWQRGYAAGMLAAQQMLNKQVA